MKMASNSDFRDALIGQSNFVILSLPPVLPLRILLLLSLTGFVMSRFRRDPVNDVCSSAPCQNGGECVDLTSGDGVKKFECACLEGFDGLTCQKRVDPCNPEPCENDGLCIPRGRTNYRCRCPKGFHGRRCHLKTKDNACESNPCGPHGKCVPTDADYICECKDGYSGPRCRHSNHVSTEPSVPVVVVGADDTQIQGLVIALIVIICLIVIILFLCCIHCARVFNRISSIKSSRALVDVPGSGHAGADPGWWETSKILCLEFFCCRGNADAASKSSIDDVTGVIVPAKEYESMRRGAIEKYPKGENMRHSSVGNIAYSSSGRTERQKLEGNVQNHTRISDNSPPGYRYENSLTKNVGRKHSPSENKNRNITGHLQMEHNRKPVGKPPNEEISQETPPIEGVGSDEIGRQELGREPQGILRTEQFAGGTSGSSSAGRHKTVSHEGDVDKPHVTFISSSEESAFLDTGGMQNNSAPIERSHLTNYGFPPNELPDAGLALANTSRSNPESVYGRHRRDSKSSYPMVYYDEDGVNWPIAPSQRRRGTLSEEFSVDHRRSRQGAIRLKGNDSLGRNPTKVSRYLRYEDDTRLHNNNNDLYSDENSQSTERLYRSYDDPCDEYLHPDIMVDNLRIARDRSPEDWDHPRSREKLNHSQYYLRQRESKRREERHEDSSRQSFSKSSTRQKDTKAPKTRRGSKNHSYRLLNNSSDDSLNRRRGRYVSYSDVPDKGRKRFTKRRDKGREYTSDEEDDRLENESNGDNEYCRIEDDDDCGDHFEIDSVEDNNNDNDDDYEYNIRSSRIRPSKKRNSQDDGYSSTSKLSESDSGGRARDPQSIQARLARHKRREDETVMGTGVSRRFKNDSDVIYVEKLRTSPGVSYTKQRVYGDSTDDEEMQHGSNRYKIQRDRIQHPVCIEKGTDGIGKHKKNSHPVKARDSTNAKNTTSNNREDQVGKSEKKRKMKRGEILASSTGRSFHRFRDTVNQYTSDNRLSHPKLKGILKNTNPFIKYAGSNEFRNTQ